MDVNNELRSSGLNYDFFDPTTLFTVPYLFSTLDAGERSFKEIKE
ncbi:hypothetical protein [Methanosarcina sp. 1.H.A.2.2]|nr:hypothetical protein [Methanosarcina sp. 1.H.A.2.2]